MNDGRTERKPQGKENPEISDPMKTTSVVLWGKNGGHLETKRNVVSVSAGDRHSLIATEKSIYVLGANDWGQLGLGHK